MKTSRKLQLLFYWLVASLAHLFALPKEETVKATAFIPPIKHVFNAKPESFRAQIPYRILVMGGGYSPSGNQVSLESNVRYFHRIKEQMGLSEFPIRTLFADGSDPSRDLQFFDPQFIVPKSTRLLTEIFGSTRGLTHQYRNNELNADGPSSLLKFDGWIKEANASVDDSINLIYFTGHGGKGDKKTPHNTTAYLWNNEKLRVSDLSKKIDTLPDDRATILFMVQCYSGGFANFIFKDGDPKNDLSKQPRAGFFATVEDRVAAGCTPDIREENYREYSTRFWEALCGETRMGQKVEQPDYNKDGKVSLSEAHTYVIINSQTIDIPIKTSDVFLRKFIDLNPSETESKTDNKKEKDSSDTNATITKAILSDDMLQFTDSFQKIIKSASPNSRAIIESLSKKLNLVENNRYAETEKKIESLKKSRDELAKKKKTKEDERKKLKTKIKERLKKEWPELANLQHPRVLQLQKSENSTKLLELAEKEKQWSNMLKFREESAKLEEERFLAEKTQVLAMRMKRELENVVLEEALPKLVERELVQHFKRLKELENLHLPRSKKSE